MRWLDAHNVLPHSFIANDPLYTSMFVANLGSIEMGAAFHHLYEWGNCPLFLVVGKVEDRLVRGDDDKPTWQKVLPLRFTFDERVEDGLTARAGLRVVEDVLTHPRSSLGCIGDDVFPMRPPGVDDDTP